MGSAGGWQREAWRRCCVTRGAGRGQGQRGASQRPPHTPGKTGAFSATGPGASDGCVLGGSAIGLLCSVRHSGDTAGDGFEWGKAWAQEARKQSDEDSPRGEVKDRLEMYSGLPVLRQDGCGAAGYGQGE